MNLLSRQGYQTEITDTVKRIGVGGFGVGVGLVGSKFVGDTVEAMVTTAPVTAASTLTQKATSWLANNIPKGAAAYLLSKYDSGNKEVDMVLNGMTYGIAGSIVVDTYSRAKNSGVPTMVLDPSANMRIEALTKENAALKSAIQKLGPASNEFVGAGSIPSVNTAQRGSIQDRYEFAQPKRPMENRFEFAQTKRQVDDQFEFMDPHKTISPEVLSAGFGFMGVS